MELSDNGLYYRRVPWKPTDQNWWTCKDEICWPEIGTTKLRKLRKDESPRLDEACEPVHGKSGSFELGLSGNYTLTPSAEVVRLAARDNFEKFRVISFLVKEIRQLGLMVQHDPILQGGPCDPQKELIEENTHSLIVPVDYVQLVSESLGIRRQLLDLAFEVDVDTGKLLRRYTDMKREALNWDLP